VALRVHPRNPRYHGGGPPLVKPFCLGLRRCAFQLNELRISSALQAAIAAGVIAYLFSDVAPGAETKLWPYLLACYVALACIVPWLVGCFVEGEFGFRLSAVLGIVVALPLAVSAYYLQQSAYYWISYVFWSLTGLWPIHVVLSCVAVVRSRETPWA